MKPFPYIISLLWLIGFSNNSYAQVVVQNDWTHQFLEQQGMILPIQSETDFNKDSIVNGQMDSKFMPFDVKFITGKESMNWLKIDVHNRTEKTQTLYIGTTRFEYLTLWLKKNTSIEGPLINGQKVPTEDKVVKINGLSFFKFIIDKNEKAILYLKAVNKNAPTTPQQVVSLIVANEKYFHENYEQASSLTFLFLGAMGIMFIFNFLLFAMTRLKTYFYYSGYVICQIFFQMVFVPQFSYPLYGHMDVNQSPISNLGSLITIFYILVSQGILEIKKYHPRVYTFLNVMIVLQLVGFVTSSLGLTSISVLCNYLSAFCTFPTVFAISFLMLLKRHIPGTFFFIAMIFYFTGVMLFLFSLTNVIPTIFFGFSIVTILQICVVCEVALFSLGIGIKINEMQDIKNQEELERLKSEQLLVENEKINQQRNELEKTLDKLKTTQNQLVQKEKLASLGELTAGIAHEIQNPLNFVNNFSELSVDLVKDLKDELKRPEKDEAYIDELFDDLSQNQDKINHHGKRASSIVKGMLEHSRASTGERELTDINALADEYLRLSYHGMRAKDKSFNADYKTEFDSNLPKINVIPQDIGRVLLNLINNAFYAVHERNLRGLKNLEGLKTYTPSVLVTTKLHDNQIIIKVKDNGTGMPESVLAKVFQPFFTTKPTGEGTGLGLSLSYDIVTKGHGGALEVESTEGVGSEFIIHLPFKTNR